MKKLKELLSDILFNIGCFFQDIALLLDDSDLIEYTDEDLDL